MKIRIAILHDGYKVMKAASLKQVQGNKTTWRKDRKEQKKNIAELLKIVRCSNRTKQKWGMMQLIFTSSCKTCKLQVYQIDFVAVDGKKPFPRLVLQLLLLQLQQLLLRRRRVPGIDDLWRHGVTLKANQHRNSLIESGSVFRTWYEELDIRKMNFRNKIEKIIFDSSLLSHSKPWNQGRHAMKKDATKS